MVVSEKPTNNRVGTKFFYMKKKVEQKFALKLNKKAVATIKGGASSAGGGDAAAAGSGQAKNTCQWSSCDNCHSWKCNIS